MNYLTRSLLALNDNRLLDGFRWQHWRQRSTGNIGGTRCREHPGGTQASVLANPGVLSRATSTRD